MVIRALEQRDGVDLLSAPKVTTLSGRQAQISVVDARRIVLDVNQNQGGQQGGGACRCQPQAFEQGAAVFVDGLGRDFVLGQREAAVGVKDLA